MSEFMDDYRGAVVLVTAIEITITESYAPTKPAYCVGVSTFAHPLILFAIKRHLLV